MNRPRDRQSSLGLLPRMEARLWADGKTTTYRYHPVGDLPDLHADKRVTARVYDATTEVRRKTL